MFVMGQTQRQMMNWIFAVFAMLLAAQDVRQQQGDGNATRYTTR